MNADPDLSAAKARFLAIASQVDPLAPLRRRPWTTVATAAAAGAILAASDQSLAALIPAARAVSGVFQAITAALDRFMKPPPASTEQPDNAAASL